MRVLLCYPHRPDAYHKIGFVLPPLGLGYLASVLRDNGHQPDIIDFNLGDRQPEYGAYDVVGISCDTSRVNEGCAIARQAKAAGKTVVMGGPHPTFSDREMLETGFCDYVVRGEGEWVFLNLLNSLQSGKDISGVQGISFLSEQKEIIRTPDAEPPDARTLPRPARDLLKVTAYQRLEMGGRKITSLVTSRGCPYQCSFCSSSAFSGLKWRANDPEAVVDEVEEIVHSYGFHGIAFLDDNFTQDPDRVREICREINRRDLDIFWWCFSRADVVLRHEDMIAAMARAGARYVFMGFESRSA
ncbi:MAG: B12-binding domain-containing radical SAM protein, partial [bacterium]